MYNQAAHIQNYEPKVKSVGKQLVRYAMAEIYWLIYKLVVHKFI